MVTLRGGAQASHYSGFSYRQNRALSIQASVVAVCGLSSCALWTLEPGFRSCGAGAQLPSSMWYPPGAGVKHTYPALVGGLLTTGATRQAQKEEF